MKKNVKLFFIIFLSILLSSCYAETKTANTNKGAVNQEKVKTALLERLKAEKQEVESANISAVVKEVKKDLEIKHEKTLK